MEWPSEQKQFYEGPQGPGDTLGYRSSSTRDAKGLGVGFVRFSVDSHVERSTSTRAAKGHEALHSHALPTATTGFLSRRPVSTVVT